MKRIPLKGGDEQDALTGWRKWLVSMKRPGKVKRAKRSYARRFRRAAKSDAARQVAE